MSIANLNGYDMSSVIPCLFNNGASTQGTIQCNLIGNLVFVTLNMDYFNFSTNANNAISTSINLPSQYRPLTQQIVPCMFLSGAGVPTFVTATISVGGLLTFDNGTATAWPNSTLGMQGTVIVFHQ